MKTLFKKLLSGIILILMSYSIYAQTMTIDLSTGVSGTTSINHGLNDDDWTILTPGATSSIPAKCSTGSIGAYYPYTCQPPIGRWITPDIDSQHDIDYPSCTPVGGTYKYRMSFALDPCVKTVNNAQLTLTFAQADNACTGIWINNNYHSLSYGFNGPCSINNVITILPSEFSSGVNIITVEVYNLDNVTGMALNGNLVINYTQVPPAIPSFSAATNYCIGAPVTLNASSSSVLASHYWKVEACNAAGIPSGYAWQSQIFNSSVPASCTLPPSGKGGPDMICGNYYKITLAGKNCGPTWAFMSKIIYIGCKPKVYFTGSTSALPCGYKGAALINVTTDANLNWSNYTVTITPGSSPGNTVVMGTPIYVTPSTTTTYTIIVTDNTTGCSTTAYWTVTVGLALNLAGSSATVCYGNSGGISVALPSGLNMNNYTMTIKELPSMNTVYTGQPNIAIMVNPTVTTTYVITVTEIEGCTTTLYWTIKVIYCKRSFFVNPNVSNTGYFTMQATHDGGPDASEPGFGYAWFLEALDAATGEPVYTFVNPDCWHTSDLTISNIFEGVDATTADGYSGEVTSVACPSDEGKFPYGPTYRITKASWSDVAEWDQYSVTIAPVYGKTGNQMVVIEDAKAPDMRHLLAQHKKGVTPAAAEQETITVYPNPGTGLFTVNTNENIQGIIEVYDLMGKRVQVIHINSQSSEYPIDLTGFSKGIYTVTITTGEQTTTKKIVIE
jgi:hypothetical protein